MRNRYYVERGQTQALIYDRLESSDIPIARCSDFDWALSAVEAMNADQDDAAMRVAVAMAAHI